MEMEQKYILLGVKKKENILEYEVIKEINRETIQDVYDQHRLMKDKLPEYDLQIVLFNQETGRLFCVFDAGNLDSRELKNDFYGYVMDSITKAKNYEQTHPEEFSKETAQLEKNLLQDYTTHQQLLESLERLYQEKTERIDAKVEDYNEYQDRGSGFNLSGAGFSFYDLQAAELTGRKVDGIDFTSAREILPERRER